MAITLKKVADMPLNGAGQRVISGTNWDANCDTLTGVINGGLDTNNLSASANIAGTQIAATTVSRSNAKTDFEIASMMYWIDL